MQRILIAGGRFLRGLGAGIANVAFGLFAALCVMAWGLEHIAKGLGLDKSALEYILRLFGN